MIGQAQGNLLKFFSFFFSHILFSTLFLQNPALADSDSRQATAGEKKLIAHFIKALSAALPGCPQGWVESERTTLEDNEYVSLDTGDEVLQMEYRVSFRDETRLAGIGQQKMEVYEKQAGKQGSECEKITAQMELIQAEFEKKSEPLVKEIELASSKGNLAALQTLSSKMEALTREMEEKVAPLNARLTEMGQEVEAAANTIDESDTTFWMDVEANRDYVSLYEHSPDAQAAKAAGVADTAYRTEQELDGWAEKESTFRVFLGSWKMEAANVEEGTDAAMKGIMDQTKPLLIQNLVITLTGEEKRCRKALESLNWESLKGMIGKGAE